MIGLLVCLFKRLSLFALHPFHVLFLVKQVFVLHSKLLCLVSELVHFFCEVPRHYSIDALVEAADLVILFDYKQSHSSDDLMALSKVHGRLCNAILRQIRIMRRRACLHLRVIRPVRQQIVNGMRLRPEPLFQKVVLILRDFAVLAPLSCALSCHQSRARVRVYAFFV